MASTLEHSRAILAEMTRLLDEGMGYYHGLPQQPAALPPAPAVHVPTISLPPDVASAKELVSRYSLFPKRGGVDITPVCCCVTLISRAVKKKK